ncbi:MAG TPA: AAA family ATPase [Candidatus Paceibacterota bacterium]|nr:AAA family ATPase [Candidatus Paceibacterota bacterium]
MTQPEALTILQSGANIFLTGEPGSGKTHTINDYVAWLRECGIEPSVTAATGIAATHISGMTLHSWSGIGIEDNLSAADIDRIASKEHVARRIQKAKVLIIDEVSMLSAATFEAADAVCREVRRVALPFGGLQVIVVGDFFQLPPVTKMGRETQFAYQSSTWRELNPLVCYLTDQHRQDDPIFLSILSAIRSGEVEELHFEQLTSRRITPEESPADMPKLFSHNADVDRLNAAELAKLPGSAKKFLMNSQGKDSMIEGLKRGCLSPEILELKEGASVMFTKNSPQGKFVNGTLGTVVEFETGSKLPLVETRDGTYVTAEPMEWQVEENGKVRAQISQVPLRLAWAMTVHKSQGMSMDAAVMDLSQAFEYGQGYVALSRVRRLEGVHLLGINQRALAVHPEILEKDREFRESSDIVASTFARMPQSEVADMQKQFVKAMGGAVVSSESGVGGSKKEKVKIGKGMPGRLAETLQAVRDARSLTDAAKARGLTESTIVKHLEELASIGTLASSDFLHLLPGGNALDEIREAFRVVSDDRLAPVWSALKGEYSYEIIRLTRLAK